MKLNYKKIFLVGLAFFLISMFWQAYDNIIAKILIDKFGLNQTWSGVVMAADNMLAIFLLPLFGSLSDKTKTKLGRRTPYIILGTIVAAFAFMALTFVDNMQTVKIENDTLIVQDYGSIQGKTLTVSEWENVITGMADERVNALNDGQITQKQYDSFESDIYQPMTQVLTDNKDGTLSTFENNDLKDGYYSYLSTRAWQLTAENPVPFIIFCVVLFIALVAMSIFRSPAVALMPDVTVKPLRSKANAIINLMGTIGGLVVLGILWAFGLDKLSYVKYAGAFITIGILMLVILGLFLFMVKEPKLVAEKEADDIKYGLTEENEAKQAGEKVEVLSREKRISLYLILFSVFLWFVGYNAVTSKFSDYSPKVLELGYSLPLMIAYGTALVSFIPIGIIATKIGRRKTILIGITILTLCFASATFLTPNSAWIMYVIFGLTGIGWATINVNSYPMVVELSKNSNVGKYTGYYYTFSMAAQIITPIVSGKLMDLFGRVILFPYAAVFVALAFITMFLVKHGDAMAPKKDSVIENFDVDMD